MTALRSIGTALAIQDFVNNNASRSASDFSVGDYALPAPYHAALQLSGNLGLQIPFLVGTVSFFVNVPGSGGQVREIHIPEQAFQNLNIYSSESQ